MEIEYAVAPAERAKTPVRLGTGEVVHGDGHGSVLTVWSSSIAGLVATGHRRRRTTVGATLTLGLAGISILLP